MISASPELTPVASPVALTVAMVSSVLDQVNTVPGIATSDASYATAVNCWVAPSMTVAVAGVTTTVSTTAGGSSSSLQMPKLFALGPVQIPLPLRLSEVTGEI